MGNQLPSKLPSFESPQIEIQKKYAIEQNRAILHRKPTLKANFSYMIPLKYQIQQITLSQTSQIMLKDLIIQNQSQKSQKSSQKSIINKQSSTFFVSQTFVNLSFIQQIKVKWNSFIKMKQQNYLNDYEVLKKIGKGGFGIVNKVKSIYTHVIRAAKIISKSNLKSSEHQKLLEQLTIMKQLDHPNIIKLYEVYDYEGQYVLILELSEGGELYQRIKNKKLTENMIRNYMAQIIKTLHYLHSQRIVHRDLKPENMLFTEKGLDEIKLIDFGLATRLPQKVQSQNNSQLSDRVGTLSYIAPQVIYKKYNQKCDIWSAGVIFYFMVTGCLPFRGQSQNQQIQVILRDQPSFSSSIWSKYSSQCQQLIKLMLRKKSETRPSAAQVFQHRWFEMNKENQIKTNLLNENKKLQIIKNMRKFSFKNKLQALINTYIASQLLRQEQKQLLTELFNQIDLDHNGVISTQQLKKALQIKKQISMERVEQLKNVIDTNGSGQIDYTEFLVASLHHKDFMQKQYFEKAFAYFDIDHSGTISYEQVIQFLDNQQEIEDQIKKMFEEIDVDGNGNIDLEEFIRLFIDDTAQLLKFFPIKIQTNTKSLELTNKSQLKIDQSQIKQLINISQTNCISSELKKSSQSNLKNLTRSQIKTSGKSETKSINSSDKKSQNGQMKNSNSPQNLNLMKKSNIMFQKALQKKNNFISNVDIKKY